MRQQASKSRNLSYNGDFYDLIFQNSPRYKEQNQDIEFWLEMAKCYGPSILELACGTGRISAPLGAQGFDVTGIDLSASMIAKAQKKSQKVQWLEGDVRDFSLQKTFSLITFPYDTFTHLHQLSDIKACLRCIKQHLKPDGHFVIDFKNPSYVFNTVNSPHQRDVYSIFQDPSSSRKVTVNRECEYEAAEQLYHRTLLFSWENRSEVVREALTLRIFFPKEIEFILLENGFKILQKFGNYQQEPFKGNSSHHILVCQSMAN